MELMRIPRFAGFLRPGMSFVPRIQARYNSGTDLGRRLLGGGLPTGV